MRARVVTGRPEAASLSNVRAALFVTCLVDGVVPQVARATVTVLERVGVRVEMPWAQTCCGQMHVNTGYPREAIPLVRNHVAAFEAYDAIVVPSGSCTAAIRHQHADIARLAGDDALAAAAAAVAARTWELSEFLVDVLGMTDVGAYFPHRVTYHPTCHSAAAPGRPAAGAAAARGRGHRPGRAAGRRAVLRVWRHVRAEEPRGVVGHAGRQDR